jgi:hypothetical protein
MERGLNQNTLSMNEPLLTCFRQQSTVEYCECPFQRVLSLAWFQRIWVVQEAVVAQKFFVHLGDQTPSKETLNRLQSRTNEKITRISHLWGEGEILAEEETVRWHMEMRTNRGLLAITFPYFQDNPPAKICCFYGARSLFVIQEKEIDARNGRMLHMIVAGHCFIDGFENGKGVEMARRLGLKEEDIYLA